MFLTSQVVVQPQDGHPSGPAVSRCQLQPQSGTQGGISQSAVVVGVEVGVGVVVEVGVGVVVSAVKKVSSLMPLISRIFQQELGYNYLIKIVQRSL